MELRPLGSFGLETDSMRAPFKDIWDAFFRGQVLVFRGQKLAANEYLTFARQFGRPEPHVKFFATDSVEKFRRAGEKFMGRKIENVTHVDIET